MFGVGLLCIGSLMHLYVFGRAGSVPMVQRRVSRRVVFWIGFCLWSLFLAGRTLGHDGRGMLADILEMIGMTWLGAVFLICVCMLCVDLITAFGRLWPRRTPLLRNAALVAGVLLSGMALFQGLRSPVIRDHEVHLVGLPPNLDGTVLVVLSDLHLGKQLGEKWLAARVGQIEAQHPDMVLILGDIFEGHDPPSKRLLKLLAKPSPSLGTWAVLGNHEFRRAAAITKALTHQGIRVLRNRWSEVRPGLLLAGADDLTAGRRFGSPRDYVKTALANRPSGVTILLSHTPWQAEEAVRSGVGLMLSGHTHGGQLWPLKYLTRLRYPLIEGRYQKDAMAIIVSRGTGVWGPRMRLWHPGEILRIVLRSAS